MPKIRKEYEQQGDSLVLKGSMPVFDANNDINLLNNLNIPGAIVKQDGENNYTQNIQNLSGTIALQENIKYYDLSGGRVTYTGTIPGITELYDGLAIHVYFPVQTNTNCTVNINDLGAKAIYLTNDGTRVTTHIPAKAYVTLVYNATNDYFVWQRAYVDGNNYASVRQYQSGTGTRTAPEYPILTRYNVTDKAGTYETTYTRFNPNVYINTDTGALAAVQLLENGTPLSQLYAPIGGGGGGNAEWGSISGTLSNQTDLMSKFSEYAPVSALSSYATLSLVSSLDYLSIGALSANTKIPSTYSDFTDVASKNHTHSEYLTSSALNGYATQSWVQSQNYITNSALTGYATENWVLSKNYISGITGAMVSTALGYTAISASNLNGYATESWVLSKNYITSAALSEYATEVYVGSAISALTYSSVGALSAATHIPSDPVNADWNATTGLSSIKNKPTLGTAASMASTAFRPASWMPTYSDVGALSSATVIPSTYSDVGAASASHTHTDYVEREGDTMIGQLVAQNNIAYTTAQVRNIILSTSEPTSTDGGNGDIWIVYKE